MRQVGRRPEPEVVVSDDEKANERRQHPRHLVCVPADIDVDAKGKHATVGLIRDISTAGAKLLVFAELEVGEKLSLGLHLTHEEGPSRDITAEVLRVERLGVERAGLWSHAVAVSFDESLDDVEDEIEALAQQLRDSGLG